MQTISLKNRIAVLLIIALCAVLIISSVIGLRRLTSRSRNYDTTADGLTYLRELSSRDLASIDETLATQKKAHENAERDQRMRELTDGSVDIWSYFTDYVMFGDSRAVGFSYYGFLSESRVIADSGWTIRDLEDNISSIAAMTPSSVYLAFGLNDIGLGFWSTPEEYAEEFRTVLASIQEQLPNASIYVNSILPTTDAAAAEHDDAWKAIPEYSAAIADVCRSFGCVFIDNDQLVAEHADMYDLDGIHMIKDFYPLWAANMMLTIYGGAAPSASAGTDTGTEDAGADAGTEDTGAEYDGAEYDSAYTGTEEGAQFDGADTDAEFGGTDTGAEFDGTDTGAEFDGAEYAGEGNVDGAYFDDGYTDETFYDGGYINDSYYDGDYTDDSYYDGGYTDDSYYGGGYTDDSYYDGGYTDDSYYDGDYTSEAYQ